MATRVCAKRPGYYDDVYREAGSVFDVKEDFSTKRGDDKPPLPTWMQIVPETTAVSKEFNRDASITVAMKSMLQEDGEKENEKWWMKNGAPDLNELRKRTGLGDISSDERNLLWDKAQLTSSGQTPIK